MGAQGHAGSPERLAPLRPRGLPDIADSLLREIAQAAERLSAQSLRGRARDELSPGLRSVLAHPYTVFYRVRNGTVEIVRVLHERRKFPALFFKGE